MDDSHEDGALLRELVDRAAITDLLYRYCRAMDRIDHEQGYAIWHEDGTADYGEANFIGTGRGFVDHVCAQHAHMLSHSHQVSNIIIELDGDHAGSESYVHAVLQMEREGRRMRIMVHSRYIDRWSRRAGPGGKARWGIDHRIALMDLSEVMEITPMPLHAVGSRSGEDPSYSVLKTLHSF